MPVLTHRFILKMETLKKFKFEHLSEHDKVTMYAELHPLFYSPVVEEHVLSQIPEGNCVWIDSSCPSLENKDYISLEDLTFKTVFDKKLLHSRTHFNPEITSPLVCRALEKVYAPTCVVFYYSAVLRYMNLEQLQQIIKTFKRNLPNAKILILIDMKYMVFHRLRLTVGDAVNTLFPKKQTRIDTFKYQLEF